MKYTEEDLMELQKIHRDNYKIVHNFARNIFDKTVDKQIKTDLLKLMEYVYTQEVFCQKDINISENAIKRSAASTKPNTSK